MLGSVLPSEASTLFPFLEGKYAVIPWFILGRHTTGNALNHKDKFPSLYILERWISCALSILCSLLQHCKTHAQIQVLKITA